MDHMYVQGDARRVCLSVRMHARDNVGAWTGNNHVLTTGCEWQASDSIFLVVQNGHVHCV